MAIDVTEDGGWVRLTDGEGRVVIEFAVRDVLWLIPSQGVNGDGLFGLRGGAHTWNCEAEDVGEIRVLMQRAAKHA